jgi:hypothetical protein
VENLQGRTDLAELKDRLRQSALLVTGDTGTMHLAGVLGTQVLALFLGPALCFETGPYAPGQYVLQAEPECHPCREVEACRQDWLCGGMIRPEMAQAVAESLLEKTYPPGMEPEAWPGVQLYRSEFDDLGMRWRPLIPRPWGFREVVGEAYRDGARELLGLKPRIGEERTPEKRPGGRRARRLKEKIGAVLKAVAGEGEASDEVEQAWRPLREFGQELQRGESRGGNGGQQGESVQMARRVSQAFRESLERWLEGDRERAREGDGTQLLPERKDKVREGVHGYL